MFYIVIKILNFYKTNNKVKFNFQSNKNKSEKLHETVNICDHCHWFRKENNIFILIIHCVLKKFTLKDGRSV